MKLEAGKTYTNGHNKKIKILDLNAPGTWPVVGMDIENGAIYRFKRDGSDGFSGSLSSLLKEYKEPIKVSGWVNVYESAAGSFYYSEINVSKESADYWAKKTTAKRVACVYVSGESE